MTIKNKNLIPPPRGFGRLTQQFILFIAVIRSGKTAIIHAHDYVVMDRKSYERLTRAASATNKQTHVWIDESAPIPIKKFKKQSTIFPGLRIQASNCLINAGINSPQKLKSLHQKGKFYYLLFEKNLGLIMFKEICRWFELWLQNDHAEKEINNHAEKS